MKRYQFTYCAFIFLLIFGCSPEKKPEITQEAKADIGLYAKYEVKSYVLVLQSVDLERMATDFPFVAEKWETIMGKHTLTGSKVVRVNDTVNFQKLLLLYYEGYMVDTDSLSSEEGRNMFNEFNSSRENLMAQISEPYWDHLSKKLKTYSDPSEAATTLEIIKTSQWPSRIEDHVDAFVEIMTINMASLVEGLQSVVE